MLYLLQFLLLLFLLNYDGHMILARQTLSRRVSSPAHMAASNMSTASPLVHADSSSSASASESMFDNLSHSIASTSSTLPIPFYPNPESTGDYKNWKNVQDIKSGICAIEDDYCSFKNNNGTMEKASATNLDDRCLLWDPACSGNRTLAMDRFFNSTFQSDLLSNACFAQGNTAYAVNVSNCDEYNPPSRMSDFQEIRNWMRSQQCVSAATEWAAMTPGVSNSTLANAEDDIQSDQDPDSLMADQLDPGYEKSLTSGVTPSCCGSCDIYAENVDIYYWPEPDANHSCLSIIGESVLPLTDGATTEYDLLSDTTYWGCNTTYTPSDANSAVTELITTAELTMIGSLTVKLYDVSPWSSPCGENYAESQPSNQSMQIHDGHASLYARDHSLLLPSSITQAGGLPVSTLVSGNSTL